ncbi:hypothetical protein ABHF33_15295 [Chitinibacter sp. FCG-7]|uniref:adenosine deaminase n=1 Tax=Chitinibacter mangrovi TaxID=3153927 RepID=A0AAU7F9W6_9NEIS
MIKSTPRLNTLLASALLAIGLSAQPLQAKPVASDEAQTARFFAHLLSGTPKTSILNLFVTQLPKGGDLHHHFSGAIYAENYLTWLAAQDGKIDSCTLRVVQAGSSPATGCQALSVAQLQQDNAKYRQLLTLWSDADYGNHFHLQVPPDSNFFNTFSYFGALAMPNAAQGLASLKQRAIDENVSYIETMFSAVGFKQNALYEQQARIDEVNRALRLASSQAEVNAVLEAVVGDVQQSAAFAPVLQSYIGKLEQAHQGIDDERFMMRYQTYAARTQDPLQVFLDLYAGYRVAAQSPLVVGVNIVAPENNYVSLRDYTLHMRMFNFLNERIKVSNGNTSRAMNLALHAGELTLGMVPPEDLQFHITEAVDIANARRIGHGVDISYEKEPLKLMNTMKSRDVAIEINLTSNEFILGVKGNDHPYLLYAAYDVPMIISTDDAGVSRNNLSNQYLLLATRYSPSYKTLKTYVYNSIRYSFLNEADKRLAYRRLDKSFVQFEEKMAKLYQKVKHKPHHSR